MDASLIEIRAFDHLSIDSALDDIFKWWNEDILDEIRFLESNSSWCNELQTQGDSLKDQVFDLQSQVRRVNKSIDRVSYHWLLGTDLHDDLKALEWLIQAKIIEITNEDFNNRNYR